ncbi:MAG: hypothetical protein ACYC42_01045 [Lysobacter sp.]
MLSAAVLIEAIQRRMQLVDPHRRRAAGELPPGWQGWLASLHERVGAVTGAPPQSLVDIFLQRPLSTPPRRGALLNRWQAFTTLWRQQWQPPEREDRMLRWFVGAFAVLWQVFLVALLLSLLYVPIIGDSPPPLGEEVVQVEFIGTGTPAEVGGGPTPSETSDVETSDAERAAASEAAVVRSSVELPTPGAVASPATVSPILQAPLPDVVQREIPEPQLPSPSSVQQLVMVSEPVPNEPAVFMLPAFTPRLTEAPAATPDLVAPTRPVKALDVPEPVQPISRALPSRDLVARPIETRMPEVAVREVPAPVQRAPVRELPSPAIAQPQLRATTPQVRTVDIPAPRGPAAEASRSRASASTPAASSSASASPSAASSASRASTAAPAAATVSNGPKTAAAPGGWPTPSKGDDWGDSTRNRPGGQRGVPAGVYNSDGSVRLAATPGSAAPGLPPGTVEDRITNLDRAGTWLKRKPNDYEPTTFDKFWRPNETLLAEWVRKSVTTVRIPIPGTNKHIVCTTVMLALGGACDVTDADLNEQPATARPPPDIPFKPELQEDNGSIRPGG